MAYSLFRQMCTDGDGCDGFLTPNAFTFVGVFTASSCFEDLDDCGLEAHCIAIKTGCSEDVFVGSSLISMNCNVKVLSDAGKVFDGMSQRNSVFWVAMISGYRGSRNGFEALELFRMIIVDD